jgi:hypothetical protein
MKTFVRAAEIWVPSKDRTRLEFAGGLDAFGTVNDISCFGFAEGLAAKAWGAGRPIILRDLSGSDSERAASKAAGLTSAVALPVFAGEFLMGVVVFCCGDDDTHVGAIELWHHDPSITNDLRFADGYYGAADTFEFNAGYAKFPRGYGLPGRAWRAHMPLIMKDLLESREFLRANQAIEIGINWGLGIPYSLVTGHTYVVTFLCGRNTPIARRVEIWVPDESGGALVFNSGGCAEGSALATEYEHSKIQKREGLLGHVWFTGIPGLRPILAADSVPAGPSGAVSPGAAIAMPFIEAGRLKAITAWYF